MHPLVYFKAKVDELFGDIDGFKTYIDNRLVLSKYDFPKYIHQLRIIFNRLCYYWTDINK